MQIIYRSIDFGGVPYSVFIPNSHIFCIFKFTRSTPNVCFFPWILSCFGVMHLAQPWCKVEHPNLIYPAFTNQKHSDAGLLGLTNAGNSHTHASTT